jgi:heme oxygenase-like protein
MTTAEPLNGIPPLPVVSNGKAIAQFFIDNLISEHPFFKRTDNKNVGYVSVIMENGRGLDITAFLAHLISISDNLEVRCKLVPQLYDELGSGKSENIHVKLIGRYLNAVMPYGKVRPEDMPALEKSYDDLGKIYDRLFKTNHPYRGLGVAIANELIVQPIFDYIKDITLNSGIAFNPDDLIWITSHNELEEGHIQDSFELAELIPNEQEKLDAAMQAAYELFAGIWAFFDTVNDIRLQ